MSHSANVVSLHPYFKAQPGKLAEARALLPQFVAKAAGEKLLLHYDFTINGDEIHCRESYQGAEGLLVHVENVREVLGEFLKITDLTRVEVHGPAAELAKLEGPLQGLKPAWFVYECGVNR